MRKYLQAEEFLDSVNRTMRLSLRLVDSLLPRLRYGN
jgi:hypothetical protein